MKQLLLGSGNWHWDGWTTIDASEDSGADIIAPLPPLPPEVKVQAWDVILAAHFIEHLPPWEARELVGQCYEALTPGGTLILEQPDISYCAKVLLGLKQPPAGGAPGQFDLWGFYGDPGHRDALMLHRWGYTPESLREMVIGAGFAPEAVHIRTAVFHQPVRDFRLEAVKGA